MPRKFYYVHLDFDNIYEKNIYIYENFHKIFFSAQNPGIYELVHKYNEY